MVEQDPVADSTESRGRVVFLAHAEPEKPYVMAVKDAVATLAVNRAVRGAALAKVAQAPPPELYLDRDAFSPARDGSLGEFTARAAAADILVVFVPDGGFHPASFVGKEILAFLTRIVHHARGTPDPVALDAGQHAEATSRIRAVLLVDRFDALCWTGARPPPALPAVCHGVLHDWFRDELPRMREASASADDVAASILAAAWGVEPGQVRDRVAVERQRALRVRVVGLGLLAVVLSGLLVLTASLYARAEAARAAERTQRVLAEEARRAAEQAKSAEEEQRRRVESSYLAHRSRSLGAPDADALALAAAAYEISPRPEALGAWIQAVHRDEVWSEPTVLRELVAVKEDGTCVAGSDDAGLLIAQCRDRAGTEPLIAQTWAAFDDGPREVEFAVSPPEVRPREADFEISCLEDMEVGPAAPQGGEAVVCVAAEVVDRQSGRRGAVPPLASTFPGARWADAGGPLPLAVADGTRREAQWVLPGTGGAPATVVARATIPAAASPLATAGAIWWEQGAIQSLEADGRRRSGPRGATAWMPSGDGARLAWAAGSTLFVAAAARPVPCAGAMGSVLAVASEAGRTIWVTETEDATTFTLWETRDCRTARALGRVERHPSPAFARARPRVAVDPRDGRWFVTDHTGVVGEARGAEENARTTLASRVPFRHLAADASRVAAVDRDVMLAECTGTGCRGVALPSAPGAHAVAFTADRIWVGGDAGLFWLRQGDAEWARVPAAGSVDRLATLGADLVFTTGRALYVVADDDVRELGIADTEIVALEVLAGLRLVALGLADGTLRLWSVDDPQEVATWPVDAAIAELAWREDDALLLAATDRGLWTWDLSVDHLRAETCRALGADGVRRSLERAGLPSLQAPSDCAG